MTPAEGEPACYIFRSDKERTAEVDRCMKRAGMDVLRAPVIGRGEPQRGAWGDEALFDLPLYQRQVEMTGGFLEDPIAELSRELDALQILLRPQNVERPSHYDPDVKRLVSTPSHSANKTSAVTIVVRFRNGRHGGAL